MKPGLEEPSPRAAAITAGSRKRGDWLKNSSTTIPAACTSGSTAPRATSGSDSHRLSTPATSCSNPARDSSITASPLLVAGRSGPARGGGGGEALGDGLGRAVHRPGDGG